MKKYILVLLIITGCGFKRVDSRPPHVDFQSGDSIYDFTLNDINGEPVDFLEYKGKILLIVNTASECGFTPQYAGLQKLHEQYGKNIIVLGFPSNDFGGQEPGSNLEIKAFCTENYGVTFLMFEKIKVKGDDKHELYKWLSSKELNGWNDTEPSWNFCKYLINENGELLKFFGSAIEPLSEELLKEI